MRSANDRRPGSILPLTVLLLLVFFAFVALSIDIGLMVLARNQCQNAADAGAVAGVRSLNGDTTNNYNLSGAPKQAVAAVIANSVLSKPIGGDPNSITSSQGGATATSGNVTIQIGSYAYYYSDDTPAPASEGFQLDFPRQRDTDPWSAVRAVVSLPDNPTWFARVLGTNDFDVSATATAIHRPRDVVIIMDLSGSMRFQSLPGGSYSGNRTYSLNPESVFPRFGHYSNVSGAALQGTTAYPTGGGEFLDPSNFSTTTSAGSPIIEDFYQNLANETPGPGNRAFQRAPDAQQNTPGGDNYLRTSANSTSTYARTTNEILDTSSSSYKLRSVAMENYGYEAFTTSTFKGYTEGPGYWGKTPFVWPPDFRSATSTTASDNGAKDWRQRFFFKRDSNGNLFPLDHNSILFHPSGAPGTSTPVIKTPQTSTTVTENGVSVSYTWRPNYAAIFKWLKENPAPFPNQLRAGRIRYYDSIPNHTDNNLNNRLWTSNPPSNLNERFWKEYVDFILGLEATGNSTWTNGGSNTLSARIGNGDYMTWGTVQIRQKPDVIRYVSGQVNGSFAAGSGYAANINVKSMPADPDPAANWYVRFNGHDQVYRVTQVTLSGGVVSAFRLNTGSTSNTNAANGLQAAIANNEAVEFFATYDSSNSIKRYQVGRVSSTYSAGATSLNIAGLPIDPDVVAGDFVRFSNDDASIYLVTSTSLSSGRVTSITINDGKGGGLRKAITNTTTQAHIMEVLPASMDYADNPYRPRHQFWFGPMTMVDWMGNYNTGKFWWPGNVHEAQSWSCKVGIQTAIQDIKDNHPNDFISLVYFSSPKYSQSGTGQHNRAKVSMGRNYQQLIDSLWFPPSTINGTATEISPYDADMDEVPRAKGGTCYAMGFMLAYNQLSGSHSNLRSYSLPQSLYRGDAGGLGRRGAEKLIIFETDGAPNVVAQATLQGSGTNSYYPIRLKNPSDPSSSSNVEWPSNSGTLSTQLLSVVDQICALESSRGLSTERKPVRIHCIAYGTLFDPSNSGSDQTTALQRMQDIQFRGKTQTSASIPLESYKRIYGTSQQRIDRMKDAFTAIMQDGVQVSLVE